MRRVAATVLLAAGIGSAQCVMCGRTAAAQNLERQKVLNRGILIMLAPPAAIVAGLALLVWKRRRQTGS